MDWQDVVREGYEAPAPDGVQWALDSYRCAVLAHRKLRQTVQSLITARDALRFALDLDEMAARNGRFVRETLNELTVRILDVQEEQRATAGLAATRWRELVRAGADGQKLGRYVG